jgi:hypothetical protein
MVASVLVPHVHATDNSGDVCREALSAIGVTDVSLAGAGVTASATTQLVADLREDSEATDAFVQARATVESARAEFVTARERVIQSPTDEAARSAFTQASQALFSAEAACASACSAFHQVVDGAIGSNQRIALPRFARHAALGGNAANAALDWSDPDLETLGVALTAERRSAREGAQLDPELAGILTAARQDQGFITASLGISTNRAAIAQALAGLDQPE